MPKKNEKKSYDKRKYKYEKRSFKKKKDQKDLISEDIRNKYMNQIQILQAQIPHPDTVRKSKFSA